jgi:hypothetical protein
MSQSSQRGATFHSSVRPQVAMRPLKSSLRGFLRRSEERIVQKNELRQGVDLVRSPGCSHLDLDQMLQKFMSISGGPRYNSSLNYEWRSSSMRAYLQEVETTLEVATSVPTSSTITD